MWCVTGLLTASTVFAQAPPAEPEPTTPQSPEEFAQRLRPLPPKLVGWSLAADPVIVQGQAISTLLPPDVVAPVLSYRFEWGVQVKLLPQTPPEPVTVEVLRFADPLDAFGAFAQFRTPESAAGEMKAISYWVGDQLHVWRDDFYVRVTPSAAPPAARAAAGAAGEAAMGLLPQPGPFPLMMRIVPQSRQVLHSLRYYRQNLLGRLPLGDGLVGSFYENGTQLQLALLRYPDGDAARDGYCQVAAVLAPGVCGSPISLLGRSAQTILTQQFGLTYLMQEGQYLAMALDVHDRDTAEGLLRMIATNIRILR